jgi:hypothetical protein
MDFQRSIRTTHISQQIQTLIVLGALVAASLSLTYAAMTTPATAIDLYPLYETARTWLEGDYSRTLRVNVYPPATVVLLAPLAKLSFHTATLVWFFLNLAMAGLSIYLAIKLLAYEWPWRVNTLLVCFALTWAPFRVTLRNGQITLFILALLLGSLLAWRRNWLVLSGVLLGLALCKYTLSFPFIFYFVWQREWKVILAAVSVQVALTGAFAYRLGIGFTEAIVDYLTTVTQFSMSFPAASDLNSLLLGLTGGQRLLSVLLGLTVVLVTLVLMFVIFRRTPELRNIHFALLALFALWSVYHRTYDFMLCLIPVAVLIDFVVQRRCVAFSYFWLAAFSLLALGLPGFIVNRLGFESGMEARSPIAFFLIHSELLIVLSAFWSLLWVLWKYGTDLNLINQKCERALQTNSGKVSG